MTRRPSAWGMVAMISGLLGIAAGLWTLPTPLQAVCVAALVLCGPGAAVRNWVILPAATTAIVVPAIGVATVVMLSQAAAAAAVWQPRTLLVVLALAVTVAGLSRWSPGRARPESGDPPGRHRAGSARRPQTLPTGEPS